MNSRNRKNTAGIANVINIIPITNAGRLVTTLNPGCKNLSRKKTIIEVNTIVIPLLYPVLDMINASNRTAKGATNNIINTVLYVKSISNPLLLSYAFRELLHASIEYFLANT